MTYFSLIENCLFFEGTVNEPRVNRHFTTATNQSSLLGEILSEFWKLGRNKRTAAKKSREKSSLDYYLYLSSSIQLSRNKV